MKYISKHTIFLSLYFLLIAATPFLFSNQFLAIFEFPKFVFLLIIVSLISIIFAATYFKHIVFDSWDYAAFLWVLILLGSSWRAGNFLGSLVGNPFRLQGIVFHIVLILLFVVTRRLVGLIPQFGEKVLNLLIFGAVFQSLFILLQWFQMTILRYDISNYSGRVVGTFGEPNFAAGYLAAGLGALVGVTKKITYKTIIVLSLLSLAILATKSWGGIIASLSVILLYLWMQIISQKVKALFLIFTVVLFTIFIFLALDKEKITIGANGSPRIESRLSIWPQSVKLIIQRPLIGYGAENLNLVFPDEFGGIFIDRAHNALLDTLISGGLFLGVLYLVFVTKGLHTAYTNKLPFLFPFIAILVRDQVNVSSVVNLMFFWLILGLILSYESQVNT